MGDLKLLKAICEIRYPAAAMLFDYRGKIATKWQHHLPDLTEWKISHNQVTVHNESNSTFLQVGHRVAVAVIEMPGRFSEFGHLANDFLGDVIDTLQINKLERIGIRLLLGEEHKTFKVLVNKMRRAFYKIEDDGWNILGGLPEDIGLPLTLKVKDYKANFQFGPMEKKQLAERFNSSYAKEKLPEVIVYVDFDLFKLDPKYTPKNKQAFLRTFIMDGGETIEKMSNEFLEHFGSFR